MSVRPSSKPTRARANRIKAAELATTLFIGSDEETLRKLLACIVMYEVYLAEGAEAAGRMLGWKFVEAEVVSLDTVRAERKLP